VPDRARWWGRNIRTVLVILALGLVALALLLFSGLPGKIRIAAVALFAGPALLCFAGLRHSYAREFGQRKG
jgi:peptidoglycan/LPS O-acetylase OafA/YrhL